MNRRSLILFLLFLGILVAYIDRGNLAVAAVEIMEEFHFASNHMGALLSCFFWTYAVFQIPAGLIVEKYGIRSSYAVAFVLWSLAAAGTGLASGFASLLALRLALGMAETIAPLASITYIRRSYSAEALGMPTAIYLSGQMVGPALGAWVGAKLLVHFGWRAMFVITGLAALIWLLPWLRFAPSKLPAPARQETASRLPPAGRVLANPGFWSFTVSIYLLSYLFSFIISWLPTYLRLDRGFAPEQMGRIMLIALLAMAVSTLAGGLVADRLAKKTGSPMKVRLLFCSFGLIGAGLILLLLIVPGKDWVLPILFVSISSSGIGNSSYWQLVQLASPANLIGRVLGFMNTLSQVAGISAPLFTGWLLGPSNRFGAALLIAGVCPLIAGLLLLATGSARMNRFRDLLASVPQ
ncbi:MAG: MFS transporter [Bryobacterales bacterium]|nr:MFS transporter [Bryobacterales bacterium]